MQEFLKIKRFYSCLLFFLKAFDIKCKLLVHHHYEKRTPLIGHISGIISPSLNIHTKLHVALQNDINDDVEYCRG